MNIDFIPNEDKLKIKTGDLIREEDGGGVFMIVMIGTTFGYMNIETGHVFNSKLSTPEEVFIRCFAPEDFGCQICEFGNVEIIEK